MLLEADRVDAILVSSVDALRVPGRRMAAGVCIGSRGAVRSVRLFSQVPFDKLRTLCLDQSSMTSNRLAQVVLGQVVGVRPVTRTAPPDLNVMLRDSDACVLIGDRGLEAEGKGLHVMDLGEAWLELSGLPFVWAGWIGGERLTAELSGRLRSDAESSLTQHREELVADAMRRSGWSADTVRSYLFESMSFLLGEEMEPSLRAFQSALRASGFDDCSHFPEWVGVTSTCGR